MSSRNREQDILLDEAVSAVRRERAPEAIEQAAAERVRQRLSRVLASETEPRIAAVGAQRSCADFRELLPEYLAGGLTPARRLLLEDHAEECVACRGALLTAGESGGSAARRRAPRRAALRRWPGLALAASLLLVAGTAGFVLFDDLWGGSDAIAQVRTSEDGSLFRVEARSLEPLEPGIWVAEDDVLHTSRAGGALLELEDGSTVEMRRRSEISLAESHGETTIRVHRGGVIVEAAEQRSRHLYVVTDDCLVAVTGTIFSVAHGTKGSRISVIEGEVEVEQAQGRTLLSPGEQLVTQERVGAVPVAEEVAWSRKGDEYRALLRQLESLDREFGKVLAGTGLRYSSRVLDLAPAGTVIYLAMPNLSDELAEMQRLFEERLAADETLRSWWEKRFGGAVTEADLQDLLARVEALGEHLGEEVVVTVTARGLDGAGPLVLAEVKDPAAFAAVLGEEVARLNGTGARPVRVVTDPFAVTAETDEVLLWLAGDVFAVASRPESLRELAAALDGSRVFSGTPFHARLREAYGQGAQWLAGFDLEALVAREAGADEHEALRFAGLDNVRHLVIERKSLGETVHTGAVLSFAGPRRAALAWLARPAPMGALDFISIDARAVNALVVEDPAAMLAQALDFLRARDAGSAAEVDALQRQAGVDLIADLAASLGGEVAFALDGPMLPRPSWELVAEVEDPVALQRAVESVLAAAAQETAGQGDAVGGEGPSSSAPALTRTEVGGRTYYALTTGEGTLAVHYTFAAGYLIAAPSRALLERALRVKQSGVGIVDAAEFKALLPSDGYLNFSALVYADLEDLAGSLGAAGTAAGLSAEQLETLRRTELLAPTLTCAYGEEDEIRLVSTSRGGILGSPLATLLGLETLGEGSDPDS